MKDNEVTSVQPLDEGLRLRGGQRHHPNHLNPRRIRLGRSPPMAVRRPRRLLRPVPRKREGGLLRVAGLLEHIRSRRPGSRRTRGEPLLPWSLLCTDR